MIVPVPVEVVRDYQGQVKGKTIGNFKSIGLELSVKYRLGHLQSIDLLRGKYDKELKMLEKLKLEGSGTIKYKLDNGVVLKRDLL